MNEISLLYVLCVCRVILSLYQHQTDTEHATVMLVQTTELHDELSSSTNMLKLHLVTGLIGQYSEGRRCPTVVMHIFSFPGVEINSG